MKTVFPAVNSSKLELSSSTAFVIATRLSRIEMIDFMVGFVLRLISLLYRRYYEKVLVVESDLDRRQNVSFVSDATFA